MGRLEERARIAATFFYLAHSESRQINGFRQDPAERCALLRRSASAFPLAALSLLFVRQASATSTRRVNHGGRAEALGGSVAGLRAAEEWREEQVR